jgi:hypothetical protein
VRSNQLSYEPWKNPTSALCCKTDQPQLVRTSVYSDGLEKEQQKNRCFSCQRFGNLHPGFPGSQSLNLEVIRTRSKSQCLSQVIFFTQQYGPLYKPIGIPSSLLWLFYPRAPQDTTYFTPGAVQGSWRAGLFLRVLAVLAAVRVRRCSVGSRWRPQDLRLRGQPAVCAGLSAARIPPSTKSSRPEVGAPQRLGSPPRVCAKAAQAPCLPGAGLALTVLWHRHPCR